MLARVRELPPPLPPPLLLLLLPGTTHNKQGSAGYWDREIGSTEALVAWKASRVVPGGADVFAVTWPQSYSVTCIGALAQRWCGRV